MNWIKDRIRRIKRIADFLPIIWKGRDFDYNYSVELFHHQLERTAKFLESDKAYSLNSEVDAQKIRTAIKLGKRVFNEYYMTEWATLVENRFGPNALKFHFEDLTYKKLRLKVKKIALNTIVLFPGVAEKIVLQWHCT